MTPVSAHTFPGRFIVLEGIGGAGKNTHVAQLAAFIQEQFGRASYVVEFPRYDARPYGQAISRYLRDPKAVEIDPYIAAIPFADDRRQARSDICERLSAGIAVIAVRGVASQAYQAAKLANRDEQHEFWQWVWQLEHEENRFPREDALIVFDTEPAKALKLIDKRAKTSSSARDKRDSHDRPPFLARVAEQYRWLTDQLPYGHRIETGHHGRLRCVDDIQDELRRVVSTCFAPVANS